MSRRLFGLFLSLLLLGTSVFAQSKPKPALQRVGDGLQYNGEPIWLAGIDLQSAAVNPELDPTWLFERLTSAGINKIRVWAHPWFAKDVAQPWQRDGQTGKFDLDRWDPVYWEKLRRFAATAEQHAVIVEYTIFAPYPARESWWLNEGLAWNAKNNSNGVFLADEQTAFYPEFFELDLAQRSHTGQRLVDYQSALINKALLELGHFRNMIFEIANEFPADFEQRDFVDDSKDWVLHWVNYINQRTPQPISVHAHDSSGTHLRGLDLYASEPAIDVLNFHWYAQAKPLAQLLSGAEERRLSAPYLSVWQSNESFAYTDSPSLLTATIREAWIAFVNKVSYSFFHRDIHTHKLSDLAWLESVAALTTISALSKELPWQSFNTKTATGIALCDLVEAKLSNVPNCAAAGQKDSAYLFYFWGARQQSWWRDLSSAIASTTTVSFAGDVDCATLNYRWVNPATGETLGAGQPDATRSDQRCAIKLSRPAVESYSNPEGLVLVLRKKERFANRTQKKRTSTPVKCDRTLEVEGCVGHVRPQSIKLAVQARIN